ncbi:TetR/AcrR family transcriptional regulator [Burkholderia guangdongensis]|uniref:TetR/AcrR family transcriptional regulator n=1 Tax=Burkholderia guangdongensis TaxID=1792500 RepID=UPI0015CDA845|nr:TetR/AcrR family transcriptional regulator [Burkholderia guangdongensis]
MTEKYDGSRGRVFGKSARQADPTTTPAAPSKRPKQARAKFTVAAIYDGLVRIWLRDGWDAVTMRALSDETGYSVGAIYEYFPNREGILSGYIRHALDARLERLARERAECATLDRRARIERMVAITIAVDDVALPPLFPALGDLEHRVANRNAHRRMFAAFADAWAGWIDEDGRVDAEDSRTVARELFLTVWGAWRYALLLGEPAFDAVKFQRTMQALCLWRLSGDDR